MVWHTCFTFTHHWSSVWMEARYNDSYACLSIARSNCMRVRPSVSRSSSSNAWCQPDTGKVNWTRQERHWSAVDELSGHRDIDMLSLPSPKVQRTDSRRVIQCQSNECLLSFSHHIRCIPPKKLQEAHQQTHQQEAHQLPGQVTKRYVAHKRFSCHLMNNYNIEQLVFELSFKFATSVRDVREAWLWHLQAVFL